MDATRRFIYDLMSLPYLISIKIAQELNLVEEGDVELPSQEMLLRFIIKAKETNQIKQMKIRVKEELEKWKEK